MVGRSLQGTTGAEGESQEAVRGSEATQLSSTGTAFTKTSSSSQFTNGPNRLEYYITRG